MCLNVGAVTKNGLKLFEVEKLLVRLDGRQDHPVEGEQQHDHDQDEGNVDRHDALRQRVEIGHALGVDRAPRPPARRDERLRDIGTWVRTGLAERGSPSHCFLRAATCAAATRTRRS